MKNVMENRLEHFRMRPLLSRLSGTGLLLATLFFAFSLTPSLVPRPLLAQGIVSGLSVTAGYALGVIARTLWHYLHLPEPRAAVERTLKQLAALVALVVSVIFLWRAAEWQNSIRELMEMDPTSGTRPLAVALKSGNFGGPDFFAEALAAAG